MWSTTSYCMTSLLFIEKRKAEVLLQRMFEDELDPEDLGDQENLDEVRPTRSYTFDEAVN